MDWTTSDWYHTVVHPLLRWAPLAVLAVWCLWAVNWRKAWPVLAAGGWAPLVIIALMGAAVWSMIWPREHFNGLVQLGGAVLVVCVVLFCGWLQSGTGYTPPEFNLDEPVAHADHHAEHSHAH